MFTGIIKSITPIQKSETKNGSLFLTIEKPQDWIIKEGDSIATNGVCLTVKTIQEDTYVTELMQETLKKTTYGEFVPEKANVEQSLRFGETLDGHLVFGHVDAIGVIKNIEQVESSWIFTFSFPKEFTHLIAAKGSIAIDGISLTVVDAGEDYFTVSIVDYTFTHTNLGERKIGDKVNLEFDMLAKYVSRMLQNSK